MSTRVRLLPTLIGAAGVLLALRIGAMAATGEPPAAPAGEEHAPEAGAAPAMPDSAAPATPDQLAQAATPEAPSLTPPPAEDGLAQTKGEADVLQKLGERRESLDARERDLSLREQLLLAAEKQVNERMTDLKALQQKLDVMMAKRGEQEEAQIASLVKTYETMKAEDAARIFNKLDRTILVDVASRMKPAKIGAVMAAMEPARAQDLTVQLVRRLKLSESRPEAQLMPSPPAPVQPEQAVPAAASAAPDAPHAEQPTATGPAPSTPNG